MGSLYHAVSQHLLTFKTYLHEDATNADLVFVRRRALEMLEGAGITRYEKGTLNANLVAEASLIAFNHFHLTTYSFVDLGNAL